MWWPAVMELNKYGWPTLWEPHLNDSIYTRCAFSFHTFVSYPSTRSGDAPAQTTAALESSPRRDLAQESIFLTTLGGQEWSQYGLNSCGLLRGWIEIALLKSRLAHGRYGKCCFLFTQMRRLRLHIERGSSRCQWLSQWGGGRTLNCCRGAYCTPWERVYMMKYRSTRRKHCLKWNYSPSYCSGPGIGLTLKPKIKRIMSGDAKLPIIE